MDKDQLEKIKKEELRIQIQKIQAVFKLSPEAIKSHPQLKKIVEYIESKNSDEKYVVSGGSSNPYIVYNPEYAVKAFCE